MGSDHLPQQVTLYNYIAQGTDAQCSKEHKWSKITELKEHLSPLYRYLNTKANSTQPQRKRLNFGTELSICLQ
ncbi:hypothetical protein DPMN_044329 [Dreissena polymorpha]|uniref:Uncharacterized protein n=1 Tax=Dreissena polymorpha TaxID=45954 RepID=A0A9D4D486_DREPO|nr:hypothetical protein DPMN_044329 [Dreissena polymorpha]